MDKNMWLKVAYMFAVAVVVPVSTTSFYAAGLQKQVIKLETEVTKRDLRGRAKVVQTTVGGGICVAEAVYNASRYPRIYLVVISTKTGVRNLGYLQFNTSEQTLKDSTLMKSFENIIRERCLPLIIPNFVGT